MLSQHGRVRTRFLGKISPFTIFFLNLFHLFYTLKETTASFVVQDNLNQCEGMMGMRCCWVFLFSFVFVFINCSLDEPQMPSWNTTLNFPITDKTYKLSELIEENKELINYDDGLVGFRFEGDLEKIKVDKNLTLDDIEESFELATADVEIPRMTVGKLVFAPTMLIPDAADYYSQPRVVSRIDIPNMGGSVTSEGGAVSASILSGILALEFDNHLPVPVEVREIFLHDGDEDGHIKLSYTRPFTVARNSQERLDIDVSNTTLGTADYWSVSGVCLGSNGQQVTVNAEDSFDIQVDLRDLHVESLDAPSSYFVVDQTDSVMIGEAVCIRRATFSEGDITFDVNNRLGFDLDISITSPQFTNIITGLPLATTLTAKKRAITTARLPIADFKIEYQGTLKKPQCVELFVHAQGAENNRQISLYNHDSVGFTFAMRGVVIDKFTGLLDEFMVGIRPQVHHVSLPGSVQDINGLYLDDPQLSIDFYNTLEMPIHLDGDMLGKASDGKEQLLKIDTDIAPGELNTEVKTSVEFPESQQKEVKLFASLMPQTIVFSGSTYVGQGLREGSISSESYIRAHYTVETPACFSWNTSEFTPDTTWFQINPKGYTGSKEHAEAEILKAADMDLLQEFKVKGTVVNHLPISGSLEFLFVRSLPDGTEQIYSLNPIEIAPAETNEAGLVLRSWQGTLDVKLGLTGLDFLQNHDEEPKLVMLITKMILDSSNGEKIKVYEKDYLSIQAAAELIVGINKE